MVTAKRKMHVEEDGTEVSLGQVGEPGAVRTGLLESLLDSGIVSAPCGTQPPGALRPRRSRLPARPASAGSSSGRPPASASLGQLADLSRADMCTCVSRLAGQTGLVSRTGPRHRSGGHRRRRHVLQRQRGHHVGRDRRGARRARAAASHRRRRRARCRAGRRRQAAAHAQLGRREPTLLTRTRTRSIPPT